MRVTEASEKDNKDLLELCRLSPMDGIIAMRIEREPDFFNLVKRRGRGKVFIITDKESTAGCLSVTFSEQYLFGSPVKVGYLADLRIHPDYYGSRAAYLLSKSAHEYFRQEDADIIYCMTSEGNDRILPLFQGRLGFPEFECLGRFHVRAMLPSMKDAKSRKYNFISESSPNKIVSAIAEYNKCFEFAPFIRDIHDIRSEKVGGNDPLIEYSVIDDDKLAAYLMVQGLSQAKQNVVISIPRGISLFLKTLHFIGSIMPMYQLPSVGSELKMLYIKTFCYIHGHDNALKFLIDKARKYAYENHYSLLTLGLHEKDPFLPVLRKIPGFTFMSRGYVASIKNNPALVKEILRGIPYEDFSLV